MVSDRCSLRFYPLWKQSFYNWLVVTGTMEWIMNDYDFPETVGNVISSQTDEVTKSIIVQRGRLKPPTR